MLKYEKGQKHPNSQSYTELSKIQFFHVSIVKERNISFAHLSSLVLLHSAAYFQLQLYFTYVHPRDRRTRKLWNLGNYFLPSQTHLTVVILAAGIFFEAIVLLRQLLGKKNKIRGSGASFFAYEARNFSEVVSFTR